MKTYSTKANANRAAKAAGLEAGKFNILEIDGRFMLEVIKTDLFDEEAPVEEIDTTEPVLMEAVPTELEKAIDDTIKIKSDISNPVKTVWAIADKMWGQRRKDIIEACVQAGIAYNTARTQYQAYYAVKSKEPKEDK